MKHRDREIKRQGGQGINHTGRQEDRYTRRQGYRERQTEKQRSKGS